jgi:hypothetical protein
MRLQRSTPALIVRPPRPYEALREVTAIVGKSLPVPATNAQIMRAARLCCQRGGRERTGEECLACDRIVSIRPSPGRSQVTVRCLWTENDAVASVMTLASAVVTVNASERRGRADERAARNGVHHLVVVDDDGAVVGAICRCRLAEPGSAAAQWPVADFMDPPWTISTATSLAEAADAMERLGTALLVVADGAELAGILTARDLGLVEEGHTP